MKHYLFPLLSFLLMANTSMIRARYVNYKDDCGAYFAQSAIPNAGMGVFAGKSYKKGSKVTDGDVAMPLLDMEWHNDFEDSSFLWEDYVWSATQVNYMEEESESGGDGVHVASMGIGAAINCFLPLVNLVDNWMSADAAGLHRSRDAGVGGFTPYHDRKTFATRDIEPGAELYVNYGESYFRTRTELYGMIPLEEDYIKADKLLKSFHELKNNLRESDPNHSQKMVEGLWALITDKIYGSDSRVLNALPKNISEIEHAMEVGTSQLFYNHSIRSLEWLQENGKCVDNIKPGTSTIKQAGRGAFATRDIPKGGLVAPMPLIHIPKRDRLNMYEELPPDKHGKVRRNESSIVHHQLLLNYCFGHPQSTLLLSPYGVITSLINHSFKRPNAKIIWADDMPHPEWMNKTVSELTKEHHAGLLFDVVALHNIKAGDEIFIDYGSKWQEAWDDHVENWKPPKDADNYRAGYELTDNPDLELWPYTEPPYYGPSLKVWVHDTYRAMAGNAEVGGSFSYRLIRIVKRLVQKGRETKYMVETIQRTGTEDDDDDATDHCTEEMQQVLFEVPRDAIYVEDEPYTRDHYMFSAFRHEIMIPDDMFPEAWKNIR